MITPDPMPPVGAPKGEKSLPETPSAVIVTTDFWAAAIMSVRAALLTGGGKRAPGPPGAVIVTTVCGGAGILWVRWALWRVVGPGPGLAAGAGGVRGVGAAAGTLTSDSRAKAVPPAARTALSSDTPRI